MDIIQGLSIGFSSLGIVLSTVLFGYNHSKVGQVLNQIDAIRNQSIGLVNSILGKTPVVPPELSQQLRLHNLGKNLSGIGGSVSLGALAASTLIGQTKVPQHATPLSHRSYEPIEHHPSLKESSPLESEPSESGSEVSVGGTSILETAVKGFQGFLSTKLDELKNLQNEIGASHPRLRNRIESTIDQIHDLQRQAQRGELTVSEIKDKTLQVGSQVKSEIETKEDIIWNQGGLEYYTLGTLLIGGMIFILLKNFRSIFGYLSRSNRSNRPESKVKTTWPRLVAALLSVPGFEVFIKEFQGKDLYKIPQQGYALWDILSLYYIYLCNIAEFEQGEFKSFFESLEVTIGDISKFEFISNALKELDSWWLWIPISVGSWWSLKGWKSRIAKKRKTLQDKASGDLRFIHPDLNFRGLIVKIPLKGKLDENAKTLRRFSLEELKNTKNPSDSMGPHLKGFTQLRSIEETLALNAINQQLSESLITEATKTQVRKALVDLDTRDRSHFKGYFQVQMLPALRFDRTKLDAQQQYTYSIPIGIELERVKDSHNSTEPIKTLKYKDASSLSDTSRDPIHKLVSTRSVIESDLIDRLRSQRDPLRKIVQKISHHRKFNEFLKRDLEKSKSLSDEDSKRLEFRLEAERLALDQFELTVLSIALNRTRQYHTNSETYLSLKARVHRFSRMDLIRGPLRLPSSSFYEDFWIVKDKGLDQVKKISMQDRIGDLSDPNPPKDILSESSDLRAKITKGLQKRVYSEGVLKQAHCHLQRSDEVKDNMRGELRPLSEKLNEKFKEDSEHDSFRDLIEYILIPKQQSLELDTSTQKLTHLPIRIVSYKPRKSEEEDKIDYDSSKDLVGQVVGSKAASSKDTKLVPEVKDPEVVSPSN
jgi:hypothetical protein